MDVCVWKREACDKNVTGNTSYFPNFSNLHKNSPRSTLELKKIDKSPYQTANESNKIYLNNIPNRPKQIYKQGG